MKRYVSVLCVCEIKLMHEVSVLTGTRPCQGSREKRVWWCDSGGQQPHAHFTANEVSQNQPENPRMRPDSGLSFWEWVGFWVFDKCHSGLPRMCLILGPILGIIKPIFISPTRKKESGGGGARPCLQPPPHSRTLLLRATNSLSTPGLGVSTTCSHADMHPHPPHPIPRFSSNRRFFQR